MEVSKINSNSFGKGYVYPKVHDSLSFKGGVMSEVEYMRELCRNPKMAKFVLKNSWLEKLQGELGGILVTALGTGFVAPFPIAFNPFVKAKPDATEEEKAEVRRTKQYSAWRQPISAIISVFFQAGIQPFINRFLDYCTNNPDAAKGWWLFLDQSAINKTSYLERNIEAEMEKEIKDKKLNLNELAYKAKLAEDIKIDMDEQMANGSLSIDNKKAYDEEVERRVKAEYEKRTAEKTIRFDDISSKDRKAAFKSELSKRVDSKHKKQIEDMAKVLKKEGTIKIGERAVSFETMAELLNKQIDVYIEDAENLKIPEYSKGFYRGMDFYQKRGYDLVANENELRRIFANKNLPPLVKNPSKEDIKKLDDLLKTEIENAKNDEIKEILKEILDVEDPVVKRSKCNTTIDRIDCVKDLCKNDVTSDNYAQIMKNQNIELNKKIKEFESLKIDPKKATKEQICEVMASLVEKCHYDDNNKLLKAVIKENSQVFSTVKKELNGKIYEDLVNTYQTLVKSRFTGVSQALKVLVGVCITLPISCNALNWVYPRFMELCFPNLAGIKKNNQEGGTK